MDYTVINLNDLIAAGLAVGKGVVLRAPAWDGVSDLTLEHLGDSEGDIVFNGQENIRGLRLTEWSPGYIRAYVKGADPILTTPLILADPAKRLLLSPTGSALIGTDIKQDIVYHTLVVFPQDLYKNTLTNKFDAKIRYTAALGWQKSAVAAGDADSFAVLSAADQRLLDLSIWMWKGYFERPPYTFRGTAADADEPIDVDEITFRVVRPEAAPAMVILGDPSDVGVEIDYTAP